jgi:ABC-type transport system involved in multi-copper enzyme maturation permease subunit
LLGPIFNREAVTMARRGRHYVLRSLYLLVLWVLALTAWQTSFGWQRETSLGDLAHFGGLLFELLSYLQLTLVLFFAALLAASAITQEKDRRTLVLLLLTDLSNREIVLGKLFGSLLQIGVLILSALPALALTVLLGGVALGQVLLVFLILASTALAAGSLGVLLALWRDKTFQTLALTVLCLVLYLCVVEGAGWLAGSRHLPVRLNPYRAMHQVITGPASARGADGGTIPWWERPEIHFLACMWLAAAVTSGVGVWKLRAWNPSGEPLQKPDTTEDEPAGERDVHAAPGRVRAVWANPVLWREIRTRAYGHRVLLIKLAYLLVVALIGYGVYRGLPEASRADRLLPAWGLVPVVVLSLLLLNAQAVTAITSERDGKALDLLFVTDLTPREFIFGKLGGILYNTKEILLPPFLLAIAYGWWGFFQLETLLFTLITLVVLLVFAAVIGLHIALRTTSTRSAIGFSLGTIFFLFVGTLICIYLIVVAGRFEYQWTSFILFLAAGVGGLWLVLSGNRPSMALSIAAWACPLGMFYAITNIIVGNPYTGEAGDPLWPFLVLTFAFGFTVAAMLVPLLSEFEIALGRTPVAEE